MIGFFLLISIFPLLGCNQNTVKVTNAELEKNIRVWQESKIPDYNFVIYKYLGTANYIPSLIKVRDARVISNEMAEPLPMNTYIRIDDFETVEEAFKTIQKAYDEELPVRVTYNKELGYPERTVITPIGSFHSMIIDISKFEIVKVESKD